ncbi:MAG: hypothetical protein WAO95_15535 [Burkholderiales bacterium]
MKSFGFAALLIALLLPGILRASDYSPYGRNIGCGEVASGRPQQICEAIAASLTWQWMGHAVLAPGNKPSFEGIRKVYCALQIGKGDVETLQRLRNYDPIRRRRPDWRLESAADMLLRIVVNLDGRGDEPENSVFNPKSADYILKSGCA